MIRFTCLTQSETTKSVRVILRVGVGIRNRVVQWVNVMLRLLAWGDDEDHSVVQAWM